MRLICRIFVLFLTFGILAQTHATDIGGIISSNTTWNFAGSPYNITSTVRIEYGATLSIDPGVVVSNGAIVVFGQINAIGSSSSEIRFESVTIRPGVISSSQPFNISFLIFIYTGKMWDVIMRSVF